MPRSPHHGRPGTPVIPTTWADDHAPIVTKTLDCTVVIGPAAEGVWVPARRQMETAIVAAVYTGPASIGLVSTSDGTEVEAVDDHVAKRLYLIKLPADGSTAGVDDVQVEHLVIVTAAPSSALVGARLQIAGVGEPGREFSRVLTATTYT